MTTEHDIDDALDTSGADEGLSTTVWAALHDAPSEP
jgi:hypothetical protein